MRQPLRVQSTTMLLITAIFFIFYCCAAPSQVLADRSLVTILRDESQLDASAFAAGAENDLAHPKRKMLSYLRDVSPRGLWPVDDDDESFRSHRELLSLFEGAQDSSPSSATTKNAQIDHDGQAQAFGPPLSLFREAHSEGSWCEDNDDMSKNDEFEDDRNLHENYVRARKCKFGGAHSQNSESESDRRVLIEMDPLRDISPPGMWPPQDNTPPASTRRLLSNEAHPPVVPDQFSTNSHMNLHHTKGCWYGQSCESSVVNEEFHHQQNLLPVSPSMIWLGDYEDEDVPPTQEAKGRSLLSDLRDISPPGWGDDDDDDENFHEARRSLLSVMRDISPPGWGDDDDDDENFHEARRSLLSVMRDISPPGWGDDDDDDENFPEARRSLLSVMRDISPPGWGDDDDDENFHEARRSLLSVMRDISPPGWGDDDDDENFHEARRSLLSVLGDISPPGMGWGDDDDENFQEMRRSLLSVLGDISPPGMGWGDDDDENFHEMRRSLLSVLGDISPPGMGWGGDDDDENFRDTRRSLLADLRNISPPGMDGDSDDDEDFHEATERRSLLSNSRDISPPRMWSNYDDEEQKFHDARRYLPSNIRKLFPRKMLWGEDKDDQSPLEKTKIILAHLLRKRVSIRWPTSGFSWIRLFTESFSRELRQMHNQVFNHWPSYFSSTTTVSSLDVHQDVYEPDADIESDEHSEKHSKQSVVSQLVTPAPLSKIMDLPTEDQIHRLSLPEILYM